MGRKCTIKIGFAFRRNEQSRPINEKNAVSIYK